ncbi:hypothetical protein Dsin_003674 [Dipteronia sinensis]|uniref:SWIM-type domain-containing protein n=1 Tax=Dipteronia sinensis TaxID=43782 RepID=A0AAE0B855_9ROSI|nr:hypothetical protein Dsin_003674 [Dipteronia sinensis]
MRPNYELYDGVSDFKEVKLEVGQVFTSSKVFKEVTKEYAIRCGRVIWFPCNEKGRVKGICKGKNTNCPWTIWASKYTNQLRPGGNFKMSDFLGQLRKYYVVQPSRSQVYRAKLKAGEIIEGSDDKNKFKRIYICFNACKQGWLHGCRKIIGLDACHVKAYHKAQLMWAVGIDADNGYYLIAHAIVEKECHESWSWFLNLLKEDLNLADCLGITFMTDRQKGLVESIGVKCGRQQDQPQLNFQICMAEIKKLNEKAWKWLNEISPSQWSKSHFSVYPKCDMTLNNLCEIVNGDREVLQARNSPIYSLLEMLRIKIMNRRARRTAEIKRWYKNIGLKISEILDLEAKKSGDFVAHWGGDGHYQVSNNQTPIAMVNLKEKNCTCRKWNLTGIPCKHAIAAIYTESEDPSMYVDIYYHKETQMKCYGDVMYGIKMEKYWTKTGRPPLVPPKIVKQPGRPKKLRIREIGEIPPSQRKFKQVHKSYTCSACKQEGHNYKSCFKRAELVTRISKKKTTQSIKSPSPQTESSNAPETDHGEDDVEPDTDHGEDDVEVANQDFFSEMIRQTAIEKNIDFSCTLDTETWKENMMSTLHSAMENFKQMLQNLQNETSVTKNKKKKTQ